MSDNTLQNHTELGSDKWTGALWMSFALIMVVAAYYPTLVADYVPMDQWRAFRYSLEPGLPGGRFDSCVIGASNYYFFTGRWLSWQGMCAEHAAVAQISDFTPLRVIALAVVLISVIVFRSVLKNIFDSSPTATFLAVMIALLPGYAFMYYQGLTGMPILWSLLLALLSFPFVSRAFTTEQRTRNLFMDIGVGGILFLSACFIYPIFAFAVIPMAFIFSAFRSELLFSKRVNLCIRLCVFYAATSLIYYIAVKTSIIIAEYYGESIYDLKKYQVAISTDLNELTRKLNTVFLELTHAPLASFFHTPAWLSIAILLGPAGILFFEGGRLGWGRSGSIIASAVYLLSIPVIMVTSVSPWLLSHFPEDPYYRHLLPIHFFLIISLGILVSKGIEQVHGLYGGLNSHRIGTTLMIGFISIFSINQISMSQHQVVESSIEIEHMRSAYRGMIEDGKFWKTKEIHLIRPKLGRSYDGHPIDREFLPTTMAHPGHFLQMTRAILREILPLEKLYKINLVDCGFDRKCADTAPENALVLSQSEFGAPLPALSLKHAIIDFSHLNENPKPIKSFSFPVISASSQHENFSPAFLLGTLGPIWNAEWNPNYPQWVQFELSSPERFSMLSMKAQTGKKVFAKRAPKKFIFQGSHDGKSWVDLLNVKDAGFTSERVWKNFQFNNETTYTFYRIHILENGGDPSLLTIQQIALN